MSVLDGQADAVATSPPAAHPVREIEGAELSALGAALTARSGQVADMLLVGLGFGGGNLGAEHSAARAQEAVTNLAIEATTALGSFLADSRGAWVEELGFPDEGQLQLEELVDLTLRWKVAVTEVLGKEGARLRTPAAALQEAVHGARLGCDMMLTTIARHFDSEIARLRNELGAEQARSAHHDLHDPLTGLANRALLVDRVAHTLKALARRSSVLAVLFVDVDHFKSVNDVAGHASGNRLLVEVAKRLQDVVRPSDTVARLGSDEFVVACEDMGFPQGDPTSIAKRMIEAFADPFVIEGHEFFASASIGLTVGRPGDDPEVLISQADAAMYLAKQRGRGRYEVYEPAIDKGRTRRVELSNALHRALDRDELELHYQPVKKIEAQTLVTMEALLRWHHPVLGSVPPVEFIPIAEETGLIVEIGRWVLEKAAYDCREWQDAGHEVGVSINLSGRQLTDPNLVGDVQRTLETSGLRPASITFELTESILVTSDGGSRAALEQLKCLGVRLAIDDFGTGYSSLSYLAELPVDDLKIDRSFVSRLGRDTQSLPMVGAVVELAHALGLSVVAEGVETDTELEELRRVGCDEAQGYLLGRPHPLSDSGTFSQRPSGA